MSKLRSARMGDVGAPNPAPTVAAQGTTGATSSTYVVVTTKSDGSEQASAAGTVADGHAAPDGTNFNRITWAAVAGAVSYKVYRTAGGGEQGLIATVLATETRQVDDTDLTGVGTLTRKSAIVNIADLEDVYVHISGTFVGTWILNISFDDGVTWAAFDTHTAGKLTAALPPCGLMQLTCATFTSGNIVGNYGGRDMNRG